MTSKPVAGLSCVVFTVRGEQGELTDYEFELPTINDQVLFEDVETQLQLHRPPPQTEDCEHRASSGKPQQQDFCS